MTQTRSVQQVYITPEGAFNLKQKIDALSKRIAEIQAEKAVAYWGSGDGWHDNPGFNQLEQLEHRTVNEMVGLKNRLESSMVWDKSLNTGDRVQIGSRVVYEQCGVETGRVQRMKVELVGYLESDIKKMRIAYDSPMGKSLLDKTLGEEFEITIPMGTFKVVILEIG